MNHNTAQGYEATGLNPNVPQPTPHSASDFLHHASVTLGERGKQYDPAGKQERSMTAIVAAFNAIYPTSQLTVHQGWQFMTLVKMVRGATKPHADSALDQVAYAALAAEEVASELHQPSSSHSVNAVLQQAAHSNPEPSYASLQVSNQALAEELGKCQHSAWLQSKELKHLEAKARSAHEAYMECANQVHKLSEHNRSLEAQLDKLRSSFAEYACRFDLDKEYMTKEQVLAGQAKHEAQVEKLRERECLDIETINDLRTELASCKAMIDRLYSEKQGAERELEQVRCTNFNRSADLTTLEQVHQATLKELETVRGECISRGAQLAEARARLQRVAEPAIAHNTDEPKAVPRQYTDPFDSHGGVRPKSEYRTVGSFDPDRGGLAYPQGKDAPTPL